jgi:iron complex outermembrane receptor protein
MKKSQLTPIALLACSVCSAVFANEPLQTIDVTAEKTAAQKYQMPNTVESTTAEKIAETVNIVDTPDALKYMPSLMVRKRDSADFGGATLATRIWGVSYSAKSIITVDGMPISSQLYNDNNYGPPKWFVVSPEEIDRIDVMYGPFSAAYSGNSMGAVVDITTKRPTKEFEGSVSVTESFQNFSQFKTDETYNTKQAAALLGGRTEAMSWRLMFNHQDANTQPRAFATGTTPNTGYPYIKKDGSNGGYYLGANAILHGVSDNINAKFKFDLNRDTQLSLSSGVFMGNTDASAQTYMSNGFCATGSGPCNTLASGVYGYKQEHWVNGVGLKSDTRGPWDYEINLSNVRYANDVQRTAGYLNNDGTVVNNNASYKGTVRDMSGTNWTNFDAKAIYRPIEAPAHQLSFGYHQDFTKLNSVTNNVTDWQNSNTAASLNALAQGTNETKAVWMQDAYKASEDVRYTVGGRYETWTSHDGGVYASSTSALNQPSTSVNHFSPKLAALFDLKDGALLNVSLANAYRFPTVGELYNVTTCTTGCGGATAAYSPNPGIIKPENVNAFEAAYSKSMSDVNYRVSFFAEDTKDALISQYGYVNPAQPTGLYSYWMNVSKVRSRGVEVSSDVHKFMLDRLDFFSAITWVDSVIAANDGYGYGTGSAKSVVGNKTPGVSPLRIKFVATYRPDDKLSVALGGSYQKQFYSTIDNNDVNPNTYQGFAGYTLFDLKARYKVDKNLTASLGIDNLTNRNYFLYHPFPQRTFIGNLKYTF